MRFSVTLKKLIDGKIQARSIGTVAGDVSVVGDSREDALERARNEIRYPPPVAEPRLGRRTVLTFPLLPPPQKN